MRTLQWVTTVTAATGIVIAAATVAQAQDKFPTKPIRLVVPNAAGGWPDASARRIGQKMSESWKQAVVVENRVGGSGTLAALQVAKSAPDGHTILWGGSPFVISAALLDKLPYDPFKDFAGITRSGFGAFVLVAAPALGVKSVNELIALARAQPGKIVYSSSPVGTGAHLTGARFSHLAGIKVLTVAFKGGQEALIQLLGGRAHYAVVTVPTGLPLIKDGRLLALAVNTPQRSPVLPDVPALAETLPEFKRSEASGGLLAPAGTPRPILNQISKEYARIVALPDIKEWILGQGYIPAPTTPEEYDRILREQIAIMSRLVVDIGLKAK
jgi:tripartite-type tricarboxylate transporter receptor subunit TctC